MFHPEDIHLSESMTTLCCGTLGGMRKKRSGILYDPDCVLLSMYGDGTRFNEPVWYSCGKCETCRRVSKDI